MKTTAIKIDERTVLFVDSKKNKEEQIKSFNEKHQRYMSRMLNTDLLSFKRIRQL